MSKVGTQTYSRNFEAHGRSRNLEKAYAELSALPDLSANIRTSLRYIRRESCPEHISHDSHTLPLRCLEVHHLSWWYWAQ
jgi:hypothetical protein